MENIHHCNSGCTPPRTILLEKSFGMAEVFVIIKQKPTKENVRQSEYLCALTDELSNLLNDSQWEELLK